MRLHCTRRFDTYGAVLLDVAQEHLLWLLVELGLPDGTMLILRGGTSLRKCRLGTDGRFSTDLDFVAPGDDTVPDKCEAIDGASVLGFWSCCLVAVNSRIVLRNGARRRQRPAARDRQCRGLSEARRVARDAASSRCRCGTGLCCHTRSMR